MNNPEDELSRKKANGEKMSKIEKILLTRIKKGLGLIEAVDDLRKNDNDFEGPWRGP